VTLDLDALPDDVDALHRLIRELAAQRDGDRADLTRAQVEIERLRFIVQRLQRHQFGRRSERVDDDQLALGLEDIETDIARIEARLPLVAPSAPSSEPAPRRPKLPDHLPREEVHLDVEGHVSTAERFPAGGAEQKQASGARMGRDAKGPDRAPSHLGVVNLLTVTAG